MTSTKMIAELKALESRRVEVAAEAEAAHAVHVTAQDGLLNGTVDSGAVVTAHAAATALQTALSSLDDKIAETRAAIRAARASEEAETLAARVSALTAEASAVAEQQFAVAREAQAALSVAAGKMLDLRARYDELSRELREVDGEGLATPEWQRSETKFGPLVLQAALLLATEREREQRRDMRASRAA